MRGKKLIAALSVVCAAGAFGLVACKPAQEATEPTVDNVRIEVRGYEWGPAVPKAIVKFSDNVSGITKDTFKIKTAGATRTVSDAYACDENGVRTTAATQYAAVEMSVKFGEANPFTYDQKKRVNDWTNGYSVSVTANKEFKVGNGTVAEKKAFTYKTTAADRIVPQTASWVKDTVNYKEGAKDITLTRAAWAPEGAAADGVKNPLIIWLHGGGEGGTDIDIALLGNEVTGLTTENETNIQHYFTDSAQKGAYVLAVQTPTMWMDAEGNGEYGDSEAGSAPTGTPQVSYYTEALWKAIRTYVTSNSDVDTDRIYIGGCSNGGYMTINLLLEDEEDFFAAAYPICQGYKSGNISDDMLAKIKDKNIWFLLSEEDRTLKPDMYTLPLYKRLMAAGAQNVHMTLKENVKGVDDPNPSSWGATPGCYDGHWSWIYAFNDDVKKQIDNSKINSIDDLTSANCTADGNMWQWLSEQTNAAPAQPVTTETFEAENGVIACPIVDKFNQEKANADAPSDPTEAQQFWATVYQNPDYYYKAPQVTVETANKYTGTEEKGEEVTSLGYFNTVGTSVTWTITATEECDVTITLHAASSVQEQVNWGSFNLKEVDLSLNEYVKLTVNNAETALTGTLPGLTNLNWQSDPSVYKNFGTGTTATVHLNAGENTIVLAAQMKDAGLNVDKIVISGADGKLSYVPVKN